MQLEGYDPKLNTFDAKAIAYYDRWKQQFPSATCNDLIKNFIFDHSPYSRLLPSPYGNTAKHKTKVGLPNLHG